LFKDQSTTLLLDAGALLFSKNILTQGLETEQSKITAEAIVKGYSQMGYEAVGIARQDLSGGVSFLHKMAAISSYPWLSANLVDSTTLKPLFTPYLILQKNGLDIGVIGITGTVGQSPIDRDKDVTVLPWEKILPSIIQSLESKCDFIILLSNFSQSENQAISKKFTNINIILQAGTRTSNMSPLLSGNTLIFQTEKQGKHLGKMEINWQPSNKWKSFGSPVLLEKEKEFDRLSYQVKRLRSKGDPEKLYQNKPKTLMAYRNMEKKLTLLKEEIFALKTKTTTFQNHSTYENHFIPIKKEFPDLPIIAQIVEQAKKAVNAVGKKRRTKKGLTGYAGSISCKECHLEQFDNWQPTRHAKAHESLVRATQQYNVDCLPCHVTGVEVGQGHQALSLTEDLLKVGCESCHGPGQDHAATPEQTSILIPTATVCLKCHTDDRDDNFDFKRDMQLVH
jgi:2',3'-cyclic-nucleotide 2'-phosphodiesterase (5'-nucleotidase family)